MSLQVKLGEETIELYELTVEQEEQLADLVAGQKSNSKDTLCAGCKKQVVRIKNGWPLNLIDELCGCYCSNKRCQFFKIFIPKTSYDRLTITRYFKRI